MTTAAEIITEAMHLYAIIDETEGPEPTDIANCVKTLNNLLRSDLVDGAAQYLMNMTTATVPAGVSGQVYSFHVGTASQSYEVQVDAVAVKAIWANDISTTINRETRIAPKTDVVRTTFPGILTKWHPERRADGSIRITAWQPPRAATTLLIEYGGRLAPITAADGSDVVGLPPEGIHDAALLLGRRIFTAYGKQPASVAMILQDSEAVHKRWADWSRGQQWMRMVRS